MELFKTAVGSWTYPEASLLRISAVPLFTGFMSAAVGSYLARAWRLFDFRFTHHPGLPALAARRSPSTRTSSPTTGASTSAGR